MPELQTAPSASSIATVIHHKNNLSTSATAQKSRNKYTVSREPSNFLFDTTSQAKMCKPTETSVEDWTLPAAHPRSMELIVSADSAAAKNLQNPKVKFVLGIEKVAYISMAKPEDDVVIAK